MNSNETPDATTNIPYKLGGKDDPHFVDHYDEEKDRRLAALLFDEFRDDLSRTESTCDWFDRMDDWHESLLDDGRSDGYGESYGERQ